MKIVIPGKFITLNEYIGKNRLRNGRIVASAIKREDQKRICRYIPKGLKFQGKIYLDYLYYEPTAKRDKDNVAGYFHKIFQDALVQSGCIDSDGWKHVAGFSDNFEVDRTNPRIEIFIREIR